MLTCDLGLIRPGLNCRCRTLRRRVPELDWQGEVAASPDGVVGFHGKLKTLAEIRMCHVCILSLAHPGLCKGAFAALIAGGIESRKQMRDVFRGPVSLGQFNRQRLGSWPFLLSGLGRIFGDH